METQLEKLYTPSFYNQASQWAHDSAEVCVPLILDLLHPRSVIDVGCGQGEWLAVVAANGIADFMGVDGPHLADDQLFIPKEQFLRRDLSQPFRLDRTFDVVMTLEVAEHIPPRSAAAFVASLTALGSAVVFSAAVPGQGGTNHVNEQWPWYWKDLFARHDFVQLDPFRQTIWKNPKVTGYYQHNLYLYVDASVHQAIIDRVGVPDRFRELTLVRTAILEELTRPGLLARLRRRVANWLGLDDPGRPTAPRS